MNKDHNPENEPNASPETTESSSRLTRRKFIQATGAAAALGTLGVAGAQTPPGWSRGNGPPNGTPPGQGIPPGQDGIPGGPFRLPTPPNGTGLWSLDYAGNFWPGLRNGPALFALFYPATGMYVEDTGTLKVADARNAVIRNISNLGDVTLFSGSVQMYPFKDGPAEEATYNSPNDIDRLSDGNYLVGDRENNAIRYVMQDGSVDTIAGQGNCKNRYNGDQPIGTDARLNRPLTLVTARINTGWHGVDTTYFADRDNFLIRKVVPNGDGTWAVVTVAGVPPTGDLAGCGPLTYSPGANNGPVNMATFRGPCGLALSEDERYLYVAERDNNVIRVIDLQQGIVGTYAGIVMVGQKQGAFADGPALSARFNGPSQIDRDNAGNLYMADRFNNRIRKITPSGDPMVGGMVSTYAGDGEEGRRSGPALEARFFEPWGLAVDRSNGLVFVGDTGNSRVAVIGDFNQIWPAYVERVNAARTIEYMELNDAYSDYFGGNEDADTAFPIPIFNEGGLGGDENV